MNRISLKTCLLAAAALVCCLGVTLPGAAAANDYLTGLQYAAGEQPETCISVQAAGDGNYLFLPASADLSALRLKFSGAAVTVSGNAGRIKVSGDQPFDLTALFDTPPADGRWRVTLTRGWQSLNLTVMKSDRVGALFLSSADQTKDRNWVEQSKSNKAKGSAVFLRPDGSILYEGELKQIKGRGNSTWDYPKKPYQIKLAEAADLMETGIPEEAEKTWVLLANYYDESLLRNSITYDLAAEFGLAYSPHNRPIDLYYDGEYRGSYLLSEKTEVSKGRVAIENLEQAIEQANPDVSDMAAQPLFTGQNAQGNAYQCADGLAVPEDYTGGYLLEMDFPARAKEEVSWFTTSAGKYLVSKSPEYLPREAMEYISGLYQAFEDAVMNGGVNPDTGKDYSEYVDEESLAKCYLILELSQDGDAFQSSTYFYKPAGEETFYAGPVWDFDSAYGSYAAGTDPTALMAGQTLLGRKLLAIPSFREEVQRCYEELNPLVREILLGSEQGNVLLSLNDYRAQVEASQQMNRVLWPESTPGEYPQTVQTLRDFVTRRNGWLYQEVMNWTEETVIPIYYSDMAPNAWYAGAVDYVVSRGLFQGVSEIRFDPQGTMTRAMAVTVLYRMAGSPPVPGEEGFSDVSGDAWYANAVNWAAETGLTNGYPDGTFHPNGQVTRQELVSFFCRYAQLQGMEIGEQEIPAQYADRDDVPDWAQAAFGWAIDRGIITGLNQTTLGPGGLALRCQAAAMFQRYDEQIER